MTFGCGEVRTDTPRTMILDWVVTKGEAAPGDVILFPGGEVFVMMAKAAAA